MILSMISIYYQYLYLFIFRFYFDRNKIKIDENWYKNILIYYIEYVAIKDLKYLRISIINALYVIINKVNEYFEEINKSMYLMLVPNNESKKLKKKKIWSKFKDLIVSVNINSDDYDEKYMKIKFNLDDKVK